MNFLLLPSRFLVFLRYQCYYGNPLLTYLEYPILIAQGKGPRLTRACLGEPLLLSQSLSFQTSPCCSVSFTLTET